MISIIHPSRGRPHRSLEAAKNWLSNVGYPFEYILSIDNDDPCKADYLGMPRIGYGAYSIMTKVGNNRSAIDAINGAVKYAKGGIIVVMSDDFECPEYWGKKIVDETKGLSDWILKTQDGIQDWIITLPIMDRAYFERFNYIYHPDYLHGWCDTELTAVAELTARLLTSKLLFRHNHYSIGGIQDGTSDRADSHFEQGRKVFQKRININFDLSDVDIKSNMTNNVYSRMKI